MPEIDIIIPTLGRAHRILPLVENVIYATPNAIERVRILFVVDHDDEETIAAVQTAQAALKPTGWDALVDLTICDGTYPQKINHGFRESASPLVCPSPLVCLSGDDAVWHPGWLDAVCAATVATPHLDVFGTRDLTPSSESGTHSTQPIVLRDYIDGTGGAHGEPGVVYHEGYHHNFCETELCALAQARFVWAFVPESIIEHRHPDWGTAEEDATYEKGARQHWDRDAALFAQRAAEWSR